MIIYQNAPREYELSHYECDFCHCPTDETQVVKVSAKIKHWIFNNTEELVKLPKQLDACDYCVDWYTLLTSEQAKQYHK